MIAQCLVIRSISPTSENQCGSNIEHDMWEFVYTKTDAGNKTKTEATEEVFFSWTVTK